MRTTWVLLLVTTAATACGGPRGDSPAPSEDVQGDSLSLNTAATRAYFAELAALSAYARAECGECPELAYRFLAGSRYAFEQLVRLEPQGAEGHLGLARVLFSSAFEADGHAVDSVVALAEQNAVRAVQLAEVPGVKVAAESLVTAIQRVRSAHNR
jgi:hypothetical protein